MILVKKRIKLYLFIIVCLLNVKIVNAASINANISVSTTNTVVGGSGTATLTISSNNNQHIGQIYGTFSCGGLGSKDLTYIESVSPTTSKSYTINWTAKSGGTYTCTVSDLQVGILEEPADFITSNVSSKTITVTSASSNSNGGTTNEKKEYSSDNTLASLSVDGYEISPSFSKDTTKYTLEVDESVEKITVQAKANDSKATVTGTGEKTLTSGDNTIEVKVTAENGNEKVYQIIISVEDKNPIVVTVDGEDYTVVRKNNDVLELLDHYEESTISIDDQEVVCYVNEAGNISLVILKDEDNEAHYYIYDSQKQTYQVYQEVTVGNVALSILEMDSSLIPEGYTKYPFEIGDVTLEGYQLQKNSKFHLFYAMNVETGETSLYVFDEEDGTIQRYDSGIVEYLEKQYASVIQKYKTYFYIALSAFVATFVALIGVFVFRWGTKSRKNKRKV